MPAPSHSFEIIRKQLISNFAVIQTLEAVPVNVGDSITVAGVGAPFNGTFTVYSMEPYFLASISQEGDLEFNPDLIYVNQFIYQCTGADVQRVASTGTLTYLQHATWVDDQEVLDWLGIDPATQNDEDFVAVCVEAANDWCWNRRREAGYHDSLTVVPNNAVKLGAIMYAGALYRERGAVDGFASFTELGAVAPTMTLGRINQLLGVNRSQVA